MQPKRKKEGGKKQNTFSHRVLGAGGELSIIWDKR